MDVEQLRAATSRTCYRLRRRGRSRLSMASMALVLAAALVLTAGCGGSSSSGSKITTLKIAINSESAHDPARATASRTISSIFLDLGYGALMHMTPSGKVKPALATSWHYIDPKKTHNKVFELTLRSGAKFSDGTKVTADSVVKWFKYFVKSPGVYASVFGSDPKFTATGPRTVKIEMTSPNPDLPLLLSDQGDNAGFVLSPKAIDNPKLLDSATYGAGPYKLLASESVNGDHYTFVPNPYYYDKGATRFKKIDLKIISDAGARLQAQLSGQYDVTIGDPTTESAAKSAGLRVKSASQGTFFLSLDLKHHNAPALRNLKVRQAFNYAINRKAIAKSLFGTSVSPSWGFGTADGKTENEDNVHYKYDPAKAKRLLAEAGYASGLTLDTIYPSYFGSFSKSLMSTVAKNLNAVGIHLNMKSFPNETAYSNYVFKYKATVIHTNNLRDVTPTLYNLYLAPSGAVNFFGGDSEITRLYKKGAASSDPATYWKKMWKRLSEQAYTVPLVDYPTFYYVSKGIGGVKLSKTFGASLPTDWYPTAG